MKSPCEKSASTDPDADVPFIEKSILDGTDAWPAWPSTPVPQEDVNPRSQAYVWVVLASDGGSIVDKGFGRFFGEAGFDAGGK